MSNYLTYFGYTSSEILDVMPALASGPTVPFDQRRRMLIVRGIQTGLAKLGFDWHGVKPTGSLDAMTNKVMIFMFGAQWENQYTWGDIFSTLHKDIESGKTFDGRLLDRGKGWCEPGFYRSGDNCIFDESYKPPPGAPPVRPPSTTQSGPPLLAGMDTTTMLLVAGAFVGVYFLLGKK